MNLGPVIIEETFAEAFRMWAARLVVTALNEHWLDVAVRTVTGYGTSVIGCDAEAGLERKLAADQTPDGRPGAAVLFFAFNAEKLGKAVLNRTGQCLMTCPTTAVYDGMPGVKKSEDSARFDLAKKLRFFGDGGQKSKVIDGRRFWRVPVMDGEFTCEESAGAVKAIAGGNFLLCGEDQRGTLAAAERAVAAIAPLPGVVTPFPGGVVRSGSKVGSRYKALFASTNDAFCPTLRALTTSSMGRASRPSTGGTPVPLKPTGGTPVPPEPPYSLPAKVNCVYEIVINGLSADAISNAMRAGIAAACSFPSPLRERAAASASSPPGEGDRSPSTIHPLVAISAGNYGGNLGKFHFKLHEILSAPPVAATPSSVSFRLDGRPLPGLPADAPPLSVDHGYTLTLKSSGDFPADASGLRPDVLGFLSLEQFRAHPLAQYFDITGGPGPTLILRNLPPLDRLGMNMTFGQLIIEGDAGDELGASMSGGIIHVDGRAGHRVGGPASGQTRGMTGGEILIRRDAGDHAGFRMRGGLIFIKGRAGASPGYRMIAGTIVITHGPLDHPGLEMQRGTILCLDGVSPIDSGPAFAAAGIYPAEAVPVLRLILARLQFLGLPVIPPRAWSGSWRLITGDNLELGKGEIWQWVS